MPTFRVTGGALTLDSVGSNYPDNSLPGGGNIDNSLPPGFPPIGSTLPEGPPGVWPPLNWYTPIQPLPPESSAPPGVIWPPVGRPPHIDAGPADPAGRPPQAGQPLPTPPGAHPGHGLPGAGHIDNTLPSKTYWMIAYCPSLGWKYVTVDPSLEVGHPLPPTPEPK